MDRETESGLPYLSFYWLQGSLSAFPENLKFQEQNFSSFHLETFWVLFPYFSCGDGTPDGNNRRDRVYLPLDFRGHFTVVGRHGSWEALLVTILYRMVFSHLG